MTAFQGKILSCQAMISVAQGYQVTEKYKALKGLKQGDEFVETDAR
jgi:hypothetical protein